MRAQVRIDAEAESKTGELLGVDRWPRAEHSDGTMPEPPNSIQPDHLQMRQPSPPQFKATVINLRAWFGEGKRKKAESECASRGPNRR